MEISGASCWECSRTGADVEVLETAEEDWDERRPATETKATTASRDCGNGDGTKVFGELRSSECFLVNVIIVVLKGVV